MTRLIQLTHCMPITQCPRHPFQMNPTFTSLTVLLIAGRSAPKAPLPSFPTEHKFNLIDCMCYCWVLSTQGSFTTLYLMYHIIDYWVLNTQGTLAIIFNWTQRLPHWLVDCWGLSTQGSLATLSNWTHPLPHWLYCWQQGSSVLPCLGLPSLGLSHCSECWSYKAWGT